MGAAPSSETLERKLWLGEWELLLGNLDDFHDELADLFPRSGGVLLTGWQAQFCSRVGVKYNVRVKLRETSEGTRVTVSRGGRSIRFKFNP